jgi:PAS domain S-box-containing protein
MEFHKSLRIRSKLLLSFIVIFIPLASMGTVFVYLQVKQTIENGIKSELSNTTSAMLAEVENDATVAIRNRLRAIAEKNLEIITHLYDRFLNGSRSREETVAEIREVLFSQTIGKTGYIYCIDSKGNAVVHPRAGVEGKNFSKRAFIREQIRKKEGYIEYDWKNPGEPRTRPKAIYMTYFAPFDWIISVSSYREEFDELVDVADFKKSILAINFGKSGHAFMIDRTGRALVHPSHAGKQLFDDSILPAAVFEQMKKNKNGRLDFYWQAPDESNARRRILFYSSVSGFPWIVATLTYYDEIFAPLYTVRNMILIALVSGLVLASLVTFLVSASITRPLKALTSHFAAGARGDLSVRMQYDSHDEIGQLSDYFNEFMGRLETVQGDLTEEIEERRQTERALRESESRYRSLYSKAKREEELYISLLNSSPDAIVVYDLDGRVKYLSPAFTQIFGWSFEELAGKRIPFVPDSEMEASMQIISRLLSEGTPCSGFETRRYTKHGGLIHISISGSRYHDHEGNPEGMLAILRDISETKKLEAQVQHALRMEAIGTLAGGIAHDFNNLLMGIQGRVSLMLLDQGRDHPFYDHLKGIEEHVRTASDLTRQLLGFARGGKYKTEPIDLNRIVGKTADMFSQTRKEIQVKLDLRETLWTVEADRSQIEQVLLNLYVNAWQAMPQGGELILGTRNERIDADFARAKGVKLGNYAVVSITDTGIGMPESTLHRIFDPFFTTKERSRGTGLGLSSAYGIVRNHGGLITVQSRINQGSRFDVFLPASDKGPADKGDKETELLSGTGTVLLVDDEPFILDVGGELIERIGYRVLRARSGREAVALFRTNREEIAIVVLDMIMPDWSGDKTFEQLRAIDPDVKVLFSSGYSIDGEALKILNRGSSGFIQKPFTLQDLSEKLRRLCDNRA